MQNNILGDVFGSWVKDESDMGKTRILFYLKIEF